MSLLRKGCGLFLAAITAAALPTLAAATTASIDGTYIFDGNGWTGTLSVSGSAGGAPTVGMFYDSTGVTQTLNGTWNATTGTLMMTRPLSSTVSQNYTLYVGDHIATSPVLAGYFTQSDHGSARFGAFADDFVPFGGTRAAQPMPMVPSATHNPWGIWTFDGAGWDGSLTLPQGPCGPVGAPINYTVYFNAVGHTEPLQLFNWDPTTLTITFVRNLGNGITQSYTLYEGSNATTNTMAAGYYTESDVPGGVFPAYAVMSEQQVPCSGG